MPLREICLNRNIRVLIISASSSLANKNARVIRDELWRNQRLREDFGGFYDHSNAWGVTRFTVIRSRRMKDHTVEAIGILGEITGGRFDLIIFDDVLSEKNCRTHEQREKIEEFINGTVLPRLEPEGRVWSIGTRKHHSDWYGKILKKLTWRCIVEDCFLEEPPKFEIKPTTEPQILPNGNEVFYTVEISREPPILCPEHWTAKQLLALRYDRGSVLFNREYRNRISTDEKAIFKMWMLNQCKNPSLSYVDRKKFLSQRDQYIAVIGGTDPSLVTDKQHAEQADTDYMVTIILGVRRFEPLDCDLLYMFRERGVTPENVVKETISQDNDFQFTHLFFEANSFGSLHLHNVRRDSNVPIEKHITSGNKNDAYYGVPSLSRLFENRQINLPYKTPADQAVTDKFIEEFHGLGIEEHDDIVMAAWICVMGLYRYWQGQRNVRSLKQAATLVRRRTRTETGQGVDNDTIQNDGNGKRGHNGHLSHVARRALRSVDNLQPISCNKMQWITEIRDVLENRRAKYAEVADESKARFIYEELLRLDRKFSNVG